MDKSSKPGESEIGGTEQDFGATGIFGTAKETDAESRQASSAPAPGARGPVEPAVRKVVFGGVAAERSPDLLEQMRKASAAREREAAASKAPASDAEIPSSGQASSGFTQLLRKLGTSDAPPPPPPAPPSPAATELPSPVQNMGFTSLLQKLGTSDAPPSQAAEPFPVEPAAQTFAQQPMASTLADETRAFAPAPPSPSITDMFRTTPASASGIGSAETQILRPGVLPAAAKPAPVRAPENSSSGATKLFETFPASAASPAAPAPPPREPDAPRGEPGSFTRMLAMEPQSQAPRPPQQYEREPAPGRLDYGLAPGTAGPANPVADRNPFAPTPPADMQPSQGSMQASGVGITRLISMLDQPAPAPAPARYPEPVNPPSTGGPGAFTATFAALDGPAEPAKPAAKQPEWAPAQAPRSAPGATGAVASHRNEYGSSPTQPAMNTPSPGAGPSEFTRIMDASKMRELSMRGGQGAAGQNPAAAQNAAPPPAQPSGSMPGFQLPPTPAMPRMPQPPQMPAQVPGYPMHYGPQGGAMHPPTAGAPQMPGMYPPAPPPMPAAPQLPPLKPVEPGLGKLQQYVPMLLVVIIVLLVALIVTVIFLMKR